MKLGVNLLDLPNGISRRGRRKETDLSQGAQVPQGRQLLTARKRLPVSFSGGFVFRLRGEPGSDPDYPVGPGYRFFFGFMIASYWSAFRSFCNSPRRVRL